MSAGSSQDLLRKTCARSCKDLWEDFIRVFTRILTSTPLQDLVKTFMYNAPWNPCKSVLEGHCRELIRSLYQDPRKFAKISTAPQRERSDTHKVPEMHLNAEKCWEPLTCVENVKFNINSKYVSSRILGDQLHHKRWWCLGGPTTHDWITFG